MISINRSSCPNVLHDNPHDVDRYNHAVVVKDLWEMQNHKCCYCESDIPEKGHLKAVEHYRPQAVYTSLRNNWENLLLACAQCNGKKSDLFPVRLANDEVVEAKVLFINDGEVGEGELQIIDPSDPGIIPCDHIEFETEYNSRLLGLVIERNGSSQGRHTIDVVGLNSKFHVKKRWKRCMQVLQQTYCILLEARFDKDEDRVNVQLDRFRGFVSSKSEYSGLARAFARHNKLDEIFGLEIPAGA
ncbi:MAG: HNH endonuclease [Desulfobulbaceae bacterium]|nr:HNH endonuclease [Desulfobulbaceae bacterium]